MAFGLKWEPSGVVIKFCGQVTIFDLVHATEIIDSDERFCDLQYILADYSDIESSSIQPFEMEAVWALDHVAGVTNDRIKKAVVTTSPEVVALARQYAAAYGSGGFEVKTFEKRHLARAWLASPPALRVGT